jgi:dihydroflavonol-4-reductase
MRALVTGANGFIGSFLVEKLLDRGWHVRCLVRKTSNLRWLAGLDIDLCVGEMFDAYSLQEAVKDIDVVFHLAGVTKGKTEQDYFRGNFIATENLIQACQKSGSASQKFIFVSSQAAGGPSAEGKELTEAEAIHPISVYGRSKKMAEEEVMQFSQTRPATIIRPPSVFGPRDVDFYALYKIVNRGIIPKAGRDEQKISIVYISDLVEGIIQAAENPKANGETFFICQDHAVSFYELGQIVATVLGKKTITLPIPLGLVESASIITTAISKITGTPALLNADKVLEMKQAGWICSNAKAKKMLNYKAKIAIEEGMKQTAAWYKKMGWL